MTTINQKEYLKRYLSIGKDPQKKKKKKKSKTASSSRVKIIDDDVDVIQLLGENENDPFSTMEDAPQVVGIIDERPLHMRLDDYRKSGLWKPVESSDTTETAANVSDASSSTKSKFQFEENVSRTLNYKSDKSSKININISKRNTSDTYNKSSPRRNKIEDSSPFGRKNKYDSSPYSDHDSPTKRIIKEEDSSSPRKRNRDDDNSTFKRRNRDDSNSPRRQNRDVSSPSRKRSQEDDSSPIRRRNRDDDNSPPRKNMVDDDSSLRRQNRDNSSPPRRKNRDDSSSPPRRGIKDDDSPPRRRNREDNSPPRRRNKGVDSSPPRRNRDDNSPPRSRNKEDSSPPRRRFKSDDNSPPRRRYKDDRSPPRRNRSDDNSPLRRRNEEGDSSPPRKRNKDTDNSPPRRRNTEDDSSPPRRRNKGDDNSPPRKKNKGDDKSTLRGKYRDDDSRVRDTYNNKQRFSRDSPASKTNLEPKKMAKTLDGKVAGLQNAQDLVHETKAFREREDELFKNMPAEMSGVNAETIKRDRNTGKVRNLAKEAEEKRQKQKKEEEMAEKYSRWGKGLKQVEDQSEKVARDLYEMNKPLARYADDEDLEQFLKEQEREGDPMLAYIRKKKKKKDVAAGKPAKPQFEGEFMPNRFGVRPGHRWDGVDRSNGYEKKWIQVQNAKLAQQDEVYKWSTEDM